MKLIKLKSKFTAAVKKRRKEQPSNSLMSAEKYKFRIKYIVNIHSSKALKFL